MNALYEFNERLTMTIVPEIRIYIRNNLINGDKTISIKQVILRTLLWIIIGLGRYYDLQGVGDIAQLNRLLAHNKISTTVHKRIVNALNYAQTARFQSHMSHRDEVDAVALTDELKACLFTVSAVVGMAQIWVKKKKGVASDSERKKSCFRTSCPERYDYFELAAMRL
jgi:hypothetical protein